MTTNKNSYIHKPVTDHAKKRIIERTEITLKNAKKLSKHVFKYGYKLRQFTGEFYEYLNSKRIDGGFYDIRVFENHIFVYDTVQKRLLTVYQIPPKYLPVEKFLNKTKSPCLIFIKYPDYTYKYVAECDMLTDDIGLAIEFRTKQKAQNYIKNNYTLAILIKQGCEINILDLS